LLSEEEKAGPCGVGMLALFPLMWCFSSLDKNQRLYFFACTYLICLPG
jgi:hypothetical protein